MRGHSHQPKLALPAFHHIGQMDKQTDRIETKVGGLSQIENDVVIFPIGTLKLCFKFREQRTFKVAPD